MGLNGQLLIGAASQRGASPEVKGIDPATGAELEPAYGAARPEDIERACALAHAAFDAYRGTTLEVRAKFLETIADNILAIGDALVVRAMQESGLPRGRIEGERGRTMNQLKLFAEVVREGSWLEARIDPAMPDRKPLPRSDLRMRNVPVGPVVVFGASNFPLAFSVAGGDTASALAAGCPVIVKAHHAHPGTSELVGRAVQAAVKTCGLPEGVFSLLYGPGNSLGTALVSDPRVKAVGFTGSRGGGTALMRTANARPEPIPVYAEMSSINPVLVLPHALASRGEAIAKAFIGSLTLGAGQFCTNPGLLLGAEGKDLDAFVGKVAENLPACASQTMLTPGIHKAYSGGVEKLAKIAGVNTVARGQAPAGPNAGQAAFFSTSAKTFLADHALRDEVFGSSSLLVRCPDVNTMRDILESLEGQLTITLQMDPEDMAYAKALLPVLERKAGRLLVNGFPTGVEVAHAMVHGGPFPSTADGRSTSVGSLAIYRFLRPVCYQDFPAELLPEALRDGSSVPTRVNGKRGG
ncbi:aldehyde dehydrogenase (NADP(+)) [Betaproteobacteria bacterium GR16-43]|nr:aldehyde dehydrogenase (NADP(+)) [Betaproteobacteria bacterium GR16-43]